LGFTPAADEGKLEALAAYADETSDLSLSAALKGAFAVEKNFTISLHPTKLFPFTNISDQWVQVFKFLYEYRRRLGDMVFASNIQLFYEQFILSYISALQKETGKKSVVLAGGGFANVKLNRRIFESRIFENMYVVPAMGDDGAALGAALMLMKGVGGGELPLRWIREREMPYFGPVISPEEITDALRTWRGSLHAMYLHDAIHEFVSDDIVANRIVALVQGRMEFGPRALGNRSILANPRSSLMRDELNLRFKKREWFQPFCPSLLLTEAPKVFTSFYDNPHMTCAFSVRPNVQSELPAICHIDGTARPQMVTLKRNPLFFRILQQLQEKNKYGVCLNTSFNVHGKTIVCTASDAIDDFFACSIDVLYLGGWKITRLA
jgi:carbamoyltransferase